MSKQPSKTLCALLIKLQLFKLSETALLIFVFLFSWLNQSNTEGIKDIDKT